LARRSRGRVLSPNSWTGRGELICWSASPKRASVGPKGQVPGQQYLAIPWNTSQAISMGTKIIIFPPIIIVRNLTVLPAWV